MTSTQFRKIALSLPEVTESAHMDHPDFRVAGKIFATLGYPDKSFAMVKLTPEEQDNFLREYPTAFTPCSGAWGRKGCTNVLLKAADPSTVKRALLVAWRNRVPKQLVPQAENKAKKNLPAPR